MARRATGRFIRPAKKAKVWIGFNLGLGTLVASTDKLLGTLSATAGLLRPFTILRTHLEITFASDQAAVSELAIGAFGIIVVKEEASALGITALPNPQDDTDADWFVHQGLVNEFLFLDATGFQDNSSKRYVIDSKAMRKVGSADDEAVVWGSGSAVGAEIVIQGRQLVQLH